MRTDPTFARVQGPLARIPWSGPLQQPPARASGWLALRAGNLAQSAKSNCAGE